MNTRLRAWAKSLKTETYALYFAVRDPRTPWYAKVLGVCVVAYALSPIDLIPDFIPVLGYLDDLIIVPAGIWLVRRMIPDHVLAEARLRAVEVSAQPSWTAAVVIIVLWVLAIWVVGVLIWRAMR